MPEIPPYAGHPGPPDSPSPQGTTSSHPSGPHSTLRPLLMSGPWHFWIELLHALPLGPSFPRAPPACSLVTLISLQYGDQLEAQGAWNVGSARSRGESQPCLPFRAADKTCRSQSLCFLSCKMERRTLTCRAVVRTMGGQAAAAMAGGAVGCCGLPHCVPGPKPRAYKYPPCALGRLTKTHSIYWSPSIYFIRFF